MNIEEKEISFKEYFLQKNKEILFTKKYFNVGRTNKKEYWTFYLLKIIIFLLIFLSILVVFTFEQKFDTLFFIPRFLITIIYYYIFIASIFVFIRRFNDFGWPMLISLFIFVGFFWGCIFYGISIIMEFGNYSDFLNAFFFPEIISIIIGFIPSKDTRNKYKKEETSLDEDLEIGDF